MRCPAPLLFVLGLLFATLPTTHAAAEQDPGVVIAQSLLDEATKPQRDGSHNNLLIALRELEDPALLPLFRGLSNSPYLSMRVHGRLGAAALSPEQKIDLASLAEIKDQSELVQVLSAAIDDELIDTDQMATLLTWDGLDLPLRQAIALRVIGAGKKIDTKPFRESLAIEIDDETTGAELLQFGLAAMLYAESGHPAGQAALNRFAGQKSDLEYAVLAQLLGLAIRQKFASAGELGLVVAKDSDRKASLRLLGVQTALLMKTPGAGEAWKQMFKAEESTAQRIRLAMIALDSAEHVDPALFDALENEGKWIGAIARAGRAIATDSDDLAPAFAPMIKTGQPISVQWVVTYCQREKPAQGPALLELVILNHHLALKHHRGKITQAAVDATTAMCQTYPKDANARLARLLAVDQAGDDDLALARRQIMLLGISRARSTELGTLADSLEPDGLNDFTTNSLRLFCRARHGAPLSDEEWSQVSDMVQGVGNLGKPMRLQLGWSYLKHMGVADKSIAEALK